MPECIHGFDEGLCDSCFPRKAPEPKNVPTRTPRATRSSGVSSLRQSTTSTSRSGAARSSSNSGAAGGPAAYNLATQRVFHFTHIRNLPGILADGALRADAAPAVDVTSTLARDARAELETPVGSRIADHVAFALTAESERWRELRAIFARETPVTSHWAAVVAGLAVSDFVVLALPVAKLGAEVIVSDGDAAAGSSRFAVGVDAGNILLRQCRSSAYFADPDDTSADIGLREGELLAGASVPVSSIALIGVAHEPARDRVREILADAWPSGSGAAPKVAVYPPWFQVAE